MRAQVLEAATMPDLESSFVPASVTPLETYSSGGLRQAAPALGAESLDVLLLRYVPFLNADRPCRYEQI